MKPFFFQTVASRGFDIGVDAFPKRDGSFDERHQTLHCSVHGICSRISQRNVQSELSMKNDWFCCFELKGELKV
jgi:hypothetical protein